jgi:hypothetical protein
VAGKRLYGRNLLVWWNLLTTHPLLVVIVTLVGHARFRWLDPIYQMLHGSAVWHLGFWEWIGTAALFLFLVVSALHLPEHAGE